MSPPCSCSCSCSSALQERVTALENLFRIFPKDTPVTRAKHHHIIDAVARWYDIPRDQILGPGRTAHLAWVRHVAMHLIYKYCKLGHSEIARIFHRNHTTVHYARDHVANRVETDPESRDQVAFLESQLEDTAPHLRPSALSAV